MFNIIRDIIIIGDGMTILEIIDKKRLKKELTRQEIEFVINGYLDGTIKDYQMSSLLMAIVLIVVLSLSGNSSNNSNTSADNNDISSNDSNTISDASNNSNKEPEKIEIITEEILRNHEETPVLDFEYARSIDYEGILIQSYNGDNEIVVIPEEIDGLPVETINLSR